jgi:apolipoprotein D and lipocalin family protein
MLFITNIILSLVMAASGNPMLAPRQANSTSGINVTSATYDGSCYYPTPDSNFPDLPEYLGKWYQLAGTPQVFELGCQCIYAEYSLVCFLLGNVYTKQCACG